MGGRDHSIWGSHRLVAEAPLRSDGSRLEGNVRLARYRATDLRDSIRDRVVYSGKLGSGAASG